MLAIRLLRPSLTGGREDVGEDDLAGGGGGPPLGGGGGGGPPEDNGGGGGGWGTPGETVLSNPVQLNSKLNHAYRRGEGVVELVYSPCHQNGHCHVEEEVEDPCDQQRDHPVQGEGDHGEREEEGDDSSKLLPAAD